ncbi:beta-ketoacyl-ACP synthase II [Lactococcus protaetiae]|uniref:3-oxoacyl-[acyl-carrier-protein] synthase 2 n=1 Tax=Lactococcus protaetiae TaxID=2592653 RepID=A0A514Z8J3_9LACT|nr:beta-ketoacyl-ACP synthase II [Lactococcus protaetiae]MCL2112601.1 beta-ketoacyl-ACP synthase II [Streptococcaceae bacterium]QDK70908.1 beta-ketoacyl-ACP synthase II [Lactococcus protaetiae]
MTNRVVITGYGVVSAIGNTPEDFWKSLKSGKTGIGPITHFDAQATGISVAAEVKDFPFDKYFEKKDARRMDTFSLYAVHAALDAFNMSGINEENTDFDRLGCIMASGIGGLEQSQKNAQVILQKGPRKVAPLYVPLAIANMATGNVALRTGARGVSRAEVTACAAGANSIGSAFREIKHGYADAMIAGGAEAAICELGIAGFANLTALSKETDPMIACRPFDKDRNGFVMGEGAGAVILESLEHAQARGANILAEIVGYGNTNDAFHMTTPSGVGAEKAMKLALEEGGIKPEEVDYINAHGTSTHANEETEAAAIHNVIGDKALVSSTKSFHGHALGGTGSIEAVATIMSMQNNFAPVNAGTKELDEGMTINVVLGQGQEAEINVALSQDFGFGGHNAVLAFKKWSE